MTFYTSIQASSRNYELVGTEVVLASGTFAPGVLSELPNCGADPCVTNQWRTVGAFNDIFCPDDAPRVETIDRFFPRLDGVSLSEQIAITAGFGVDGMPGRIWPTFSAFPELISARHEPSARASHALQVLATIATALLNRPAIVLLGEEWWAEASCDLPDAEDRMQTLAKETGLAIAALAEGP